jgi:hydrogenase nickel incorporation protein HypB
MCEKRGSSDTAPPSLAEVQCDVASLEVARSHAPRASTPHPDHGNGHSHPHGQGTERSGRILQVEQAVLGKNNDLAERNRRWLTERGIVALNLVSAPGAGKTTLLESTLRDLGQEVPISIIEGDQATDHDAQRIRAAGGRVVQINTGTGCHLDAAMVAGALERLNPPPHSLLFIENVGNLVCPALFDLGERAKVVLGSVTEGDDKPVKYPHMFRASTLLILNKIDLLPYVPFNIERCLQFAAQVKPGIGVIKLSATRGDGLGQWYAWLREQLTCGRPAPLP